MRIVAIASLVPLLMRLPLRRVASLIEPPQPGGLHASEPRLLWLVDGVLSRLRLVLRPTCLTRGVTRYYFLRRIGADVTLAFGISPTPGVGGHCWLVRDGEPFLEARDPRRIFTEVYTISC